MMKDLGKKFDAVCDCGKRYSLAERQREISRTSDGEDPGSRAKYHSDHCWMIYTASDDAVDHNLKSNPQDADKDLMALLKFSCIE
jgi:hypothetical protein